MGRHDGYDDRFDDLAALSYRVAYRLTGDRQESEDLAQEALTRAYVRWTKVQRYDEAWVVRVTTNLAIGRWRRRRTASGHDAAPPRTDPEDRTADHAAERLALVAALRALPGRQREVAVLRFVGDLSLEDTAAALGCSVGTVKQHSTRALAALRRSVEHPDTPPAEPAPPPSTMPGNTTYTPATRRRS